MVDFFQSDFSAANECFYIMEIDINSLETYNNLARDGAESAADALTQMTGVETRVEVTNITLVPIKDLEYEFVGGKYSCVQIGLKGDLNGETVLVFDDHGREVITETLVPNGSGEMQESSIKEIGNIMTSGFIDGWANHINGMVDISTPTYIEGDGGDILPESVLNTDQVFVFRSRVEAVNESIDFRIFFVPERETFINALEESDTISDTVSLEKLQVFNDMTKEGAKQAAQNISSMSGIDCDVKVNRMNFVQIEDVPSEVGDRQYIGTVVRFKGRPSGYLAILFDQPSANAVVDGLIPMERDGGFGDMERSAMKELGNIMTSGFIDGWANVLQTSIEHSPPNFVADMGSAIMEQVSAKIAENQNNAFMLDSSIKTDGDSVFRCELLAIPEEDELKQALDELLIERSSELEADPESLFID